MAKQVSVTIEDNEFTEKFPQIAQMDLSMSDKIRVALGLSPRRAKAGPPEGNKNAAGNKSRWRKKL